MLFKRANSQPLKDKIGNLVWPKMGWMRVLNYYKHRSIRIPDSEHSIALGLAFGCAISWTPPVGVHLIQCGLFCWITKSNWIASFIGTAFGNPWTTPFMMVLSYQVGKALYIGFGHQDLLLDHMGPITFELLTTEGLKIFLPTVIGGYVLALATFPLFYFPFYYMVKGARLARQKRLERTAHKVAIEVTGQKE